MIGMLGLIFGAIAGFFRSRVDRDAEIIALRHQLNVPRRKKPERMTFSKTDRFYLSGCIAWFAVS
ncbi:MAG: hypothetical protein ACT4SY_04285 [Hyphomicrobiales bacterium]